MPRRWSRASRAPLLFLVLAGVASPAHGAPRPGCLTGPTVTPRACYPTRIAGSFTGKNAQYTWHGIVAMTGHRQQTIVLYTGHARFTWKLRHAQLPGGCRLTPTHGTFTEPAALSVNREPDHRRGWSYVAGNEGRGNTGKQFSVCGRSRERDGNATIASAFDVGGFSRDLRSFSGKGVGSSSFNRTWSLRGTRPTH